MTRMRAINVNNMFCLFSASAPPIGAIISALVASVFLQLIGPKKTLILAQFIFATSFITLGTAEFHESYPVLVASRALTGLAVGLTVPAAQIYVSVKLTVCLHGSCKLSARSKQTADYVQQNCSKKTLITDF